ncbi:tRNA 4-thiouridine(8) synthase ThiI, partial [Candidatus Bathyarchaeota archaeon]
PCPAGGCLLTDPHFAKRLRDYLDHEGRPTLEHIALLKLGRHFRLGTARVIVGRNEKENHILLSVAESRDIPHMSVAGYMGPVTLILGEADDETLEKSAAITVRYSDAPRETPVEVRYAHGDVTTILAEAVEDQELERWRI